MRTPGGITVESLYGAATRQPLVKLIVHDQDPTAEPISEVLMPPSKAQEIGLWLLQASEAATSDAFLFRWAQNLQGQATPSEVERGLRMGVGLVKEMREFRELQRRAGVEREEADEQAWRDAHP